MSSFMCLKGCTILKSLFAFIAAIRPLTRVYPFMRVKIRSLGETLFTEVTFERFYSHMFVLKVPVEVLWLAEPFFTPRTFERFFTSMVSLVISQPRRSCKTLATCFTYKRFLACVYSHMYLEVGLLFELQATVSAFIRLFTWMLCFYVIWEMLRVPKALVTLVTLERLLSTVHNSLMHLQSRELHKTPAAFFTPETLLAGVSSKMHLQMPRLYKTLAALTALRSWFFITVWIEMSLEISFLIETFLTFGAFKQTSRITLFCAGCLWSATGCVILITFTLFRAFLNNESGGFIGQGTCKSARTSHITLFGSKSLWNVSGWVILITFSFFRVFFGNESGGFISHGTSRSAMRLILVISPILLTLYFRYDVRQRDHVWFIDWFWLDQHVSLQGTKSYFIARNWTWIHNMFKKWIQEF